MYISRIIYIVFKINMSDISYMIHVSYKCIIEDIKWNQKKKIECQNIILWQKKIW